MRGWPGLGGENMKQPEAKGRRVVSRGISSASSVDHGGSASPGPAALPVLETSNWPSDATRWIVNSAEALRGAGVSHADVARFTMSFGGARTISHVMDGCLVALRRFYQVEA